MENFTLDGKTYSIDDLPEEVQKLARHATATTKHIQKLEARTSIARTAQALYVEQLRAHLGEQAGTQAKK